MSVTCGLIPIASYKKSDPNTSFSKMSLHSSTRNPVDAYAAGLIDGEGCIGIQAGKKRAHYYVEITVGMSVKAIDLLEELKNQFGGTVVQGRKATKNWAAAAKWRIGGQGAFPFLERIQPYLMLKQNQAKTAMKLKALMDGLDKQPNGNRAWTTLARKKAEVLKQEMHRLNMKGPDAVNVGGGWFKPTPNLFGTWERFSETFPKSGMTADGLLYRLEMPEPRISGKGFGYLPTPSTVDGGSYFNQSKSPGATKRPTLGAMAKYNLWPTPKSTMRGDCPSERERRSPDLHSAVKHRTPTTTNRGQYDGGTSTQQTYPTPKGRDWKRQSQRGIHGENDCLPNKTLAMNGSGSLSPNWVEWLQGYPIGATDLRDSGMPGFLKWQQLHGIF